ncbi:Tyrosyl-tRNA synthetase [hydrothermal vent metagenome]|uniref:tyrosine--tRNA ligase n=1 Tax=hydrothermal vent metagenome TaxID=652676 RepID=A0A3B1DMB8_9ZZZZ
MTIEESIKIIERGVAEIINREELKKKLVGGHKTGVPLRVKAGFDPTAPDIHLGHVVLLRKLRQFQDLGHQIDFLVGDFTALVGDPTGRNKLRPALDAKYIRENAKTYTEQAFKILDRNKTNVVFNGDWLGRLKPSSLLALTARSTVAQMLARNDFKQRFEAKTEISIMEFLYPLLQGFDSFFLRTDIELGGTDQKFNLLMGRQIQEALCEDIIFESEVKEILKELGRGESFNDWKPAKDPQVVIMTPLLEGTDGVKKMSKSLGNYIGINESPKEIFGKLMSISDELMWRYFELLTDRDCGEVKKLHPKEAKMLLSADVVTQFYNIEKADESRREFEKVFSQGKVPVDIPEYIIKQDSVENLVDVLVATKCTASKNEARRLLKQGAISYEGQKVSDEQWVLKPGVVKVGKRRFLKLIR